MAKNVETRRSFFVHWMIQLQREKSEVSLSVPNLLKSKLSALHRKFFRLLETTKIVEEIQCRFSQKILV